MALQKRNSNVSTKNVNVGMIYGADPVISKDPASYKIVDPSEFTGTSTKCINFIKLDSSNYINTETNKYTYKIVFGKDDNYDITYIGVDDNIYTIGVKTVALTDYKKEIKTDTGIKYEDTSGKSLTIHEYQTLNGHVEVKKTDIHYIDYDVYKIEIDRIYDTIKTVKELAEANKITGSNPVNIMNGEASGQDSSAFVTVQVKSTNGRVSDVSVHTNNITSYQIFNYSIRALQTDIKNISTAVINLNASQVGLIVKDSKNFVNITLNQNQSGKIYDPVISVSYATYDSTTNSFTPGIINSANVELYVNSVITKSISTIHTEIADVDNKVNTYKDEIDGLILNISTAISDISAKYYTHINDYNIAINALNDKIDDIPVYGQADENNLGVVKLGYTNTTTLPAGQVNLPIKISADGRLYVSLTTDIIKSLGFDDGVTFTPVYLTTP